MMVMFSWCFDTFILILGLCIMNVIFYLSSKFNHIFEFTGDASVVMGVTASQPSLGFEYIIPLEKKTWQKSREACLELGYHLAWINSELEQIYLTSLTQYDQCKIYFYYHY